MSHISRIRTKIVEKELLFKAIADLGYTYEEGDFTLGSFSTERVKVDIKINLRLSNDIGLRKSGDAYEIVADWWGVRGVKREEFVNRLNQRYAYQAARAKLEAQGFNLVEEEIGQKGEIRLVLRRVA